ncbi:DNA translocase FtsK 4TM domain-containing protein [Cereibacter sp. SYSU M97828]|nr:DNA translocase FtsK 4TM domain-containing protein [Cereibacter flavus]
MASYNARQRDPLLDQNVQEMLQRRGRELLGVGLLLLAFLFFLMLASYSPTDPGWMVSTDEPAQNTLGRFGAAVASTLIVIVGKGAWAIPLVLLGWGVRFVLHRGEDRAPGRVVFAVIAVAVASVFAATHAPDADWGHAFGLGGLFGDTVLGALLGATPFGAAAGLKLLSLVTGALMLAMMLFVTGFDLWEIRAIAHFLLVGLIMTYTTLLSLAGRSATGAAQMAVQMQQKRAEKTRARAESADWDDEVIESPRLPSLGAAARGMMERFTAKPEPEEPVSRVVQAARAAQARHAEQRADWGRPDALGAANLRAEVRREEAPRSLLARGAQMVRRVVDPELVEPEPRDADNPSEDRIRARIGEVIRTRAHQPVSPVTAAVQRREPSLVARKGKAPPLVADTRRAPVELPPEPPMIAGAAPVRSGNIPRLPPALEPETTATQRLMIEEPEVEIDDDAYWADQIAEAEEDWPDEQLDAAPIAPPAPPKAAPVRRRFEEIQVEYELPPLSLLQNPDGIKRNPLSVETLEENARLLESVLDDYGVKGEIVSVRPGPVVTMYELEPAPGLKASRVIGLADDIARSMSALSARVSTVPGRTVIGIELPNANREKVVLREILDAADFGAEAMRLPLALGKDIGGDPIVANLAKMPHLLIAGTTGSGKSVAINTMILSLLYKLTPEECRLIMIDPKMLELSVYDGIPHLLSPVVTDPKKAVVALKWVVAEMEERYRKMSKMGVRNIEGYNGRVREALAKGEMFKRTFQTGFDEDTGEPVFETEEFQPVAIPFIVVIVDEMADLMMVAGKEIEACIQRLAQMARASGIHLIMATQRPSVDVITGTIKANFPTRISFQVTSKIDSRTILGEQGAEQLLGMGDMLYMAGGAKITRIHGPFVSDEEVEEIVNHLKSFGPPAYMSGVVEGPEDEVAGDIDAVLGLGGNTDGEDSLYDQAVAVVAKDRKCSTSYIQRKLGIGYNKAAKLVEQMEEQGVVTAANHVGKREILLPEQ